MKLIDARLHGMIDYLVVAFLWLSPLLFSMSGTTATVAFVLGAVHLLLTLLTDFEYGKFQVFSFKTHGLLEIMVAMALVPIALLLGEKAGAFAREYFLALAGAIFVVWVLTNYKPLRQAEATG
jgi:hypothetical protein